MVTIDRLHRSQEFTKEYAEKLVSQFNAEELHEDKNNRWRYACVPQCNGLYSINVYDENDNLMGKL